MLSTRRNKQFLYFLILFVAVNLVIPTGKNISPFGIATVEAATPKSFKPKFKPPKVKQVKLKPSSMKGQFKSVPKTKKYLGLRNRSKNKLSSTKTKFKPSKSKKQSGFKRKPSKQLSSKNFRIKPKLGQASSKLGGKKVLKSGAKKGLSKSGKPSLRPRDKKGGVKSAAKSRQQTRLKDKINKLTSGKKGLKGKSNSQLSSNNTRFKPKSKQVSSKIGGKKGGTKLVPKSKGQTGLKSKLAKLTAGKNKPSKSLTASNAKFKPVKGKIKLKPSNLKGQFKSVPKIKKLLAQQKQVKTRIPVPSNLSKKLHSDAQGKHIPSHKNYMKGKSILTSNAKRLLKGVHNKKYPIIRINPRGQPVVNFGKKIGVHGGTGKSTNFGTIHSGKNGAHIIPANPNQF